MNSTDLSPEQRLQVLQIWWQAQAAQNQPLFPPGNPGANSQLNNMTFPAFHPALMNSQPQPPALQAMMQMQALQQQQQNQLGILQNAGLHLPFVPPLNAGAFPAGFPALQTSPPIQEPSFFPADEDTFAHALHDTEGASFGETLNSLNGKNGHTTSQWLTFWLGNSVNILKKVRILESTPSRTKTSGVPRSAGNSSRHTQPSKKDLHQSRETRRGEPHASSRSSRKARSSRVASRYHTRSPTPPDTIVKNAQGKNKYTDQDVQYFKKFLAHTLEHDPSAMDTPGIFSTQLAERASHHTALSWRSWIRDHPDIIDSVNRQVLGGEDTTSDLDSRTSPVNDDKDESEDEDEDEDEDAESSSSSSVDERDVSLSSSESEGEVHAQNMQVMKVMGTRSWYLPGDRRELAKHIAEVTLTEWDNEQDWTSFQITHPSHSAKSWKKWYCRNKKDIRRMARRFEIRNAKRKKQAGRTIVVTHHNSHRPVQNPNRSTPSSSRSQGFSSSNHPVLEKRRRTNDGDESYAPQPAKRPREFFPETG